MARPAAKPAITKAPARPHPIAPQAEVAEGRVETAANPESEVVASTPPAERKVMYSARVRESLRRDVKLHSVEAGVTVEEITEAALQEYLDRHRQQV